MTEGHAPEFDYDAELRGIEARNRAAMHNALAPYIADPERLDAAIAAALSVARDYAGSFSWAGERRRMHERRRPRRER